MLQILGHGVKIVEAVVKGLHPVVLPRVQVDALNAAGNPLLVEPAGWCAVYLLRHRVIHRVVHSLFEPQPAAVAFLNLVNAVVSQSGSVFLIRKECADAITVIAVQPIACSHPNIAPGVTYDAADHRIG